MQIRFKNLMLEVTRKCNMQCAHCMRGEQEDRSLSSDTIEKIFSQTSKIKHLTLTGGEPSLEPDVIDWISYYARNYSVEIGDFFCATNAKEYSEDFIRAINGLYNICTNKNTCGLSISTDQFHADADARALIEYRKLPYYVPAKEKDYLSKGVILNEGRAKANTLGRHSMITPDYIYDYQLSCFDLCVGDRIYINAWGQVLLNPDMSYETQEENFIDCVLCKPLDEIIMSCAYKIPNKYFEQNKKCFYGVKFSSEADTVYSIPISTEQYYERPEQAVVAYQSILNNIQLTPLNPKVTKIPDNLKLVFSFLQAEDNRCDGTKIIYKLPEKEPKTVTIEIFKYPLEEVKDNEW